MFIRAFIVIALIVLFYFFTNPAVENLSPQGNTTEIFCDEERSESFEALTFVNDGRAYPNADIPSGKYSIEYEKSKTIPSLTSNTDASNDWTNIGPDNIGGRMLCVAISPADTSILWAGSASGGLWKSTNGGLGTTAWVNVPTGFQTLGVSSIAIDSANTNTMYIGTGEVYGYTNALNGLSTRTTRGSYGIGILKTTNGGTNWTKSLDWTYSQNRGVADLVMNPKNSSTVYAATSEGIYKTINGGSNWTQVFTGTMVMDLEIDRIDTNVIYAGVGNLSSATQGIYQSTNSGANWTELTNGVPGTNTGRVTLASFAGNHRTVFAVIGSRTSSAGTVGVYRTTDQGASWTQTSGGTPDILEDQGWYAAGVKVKDDDSSQILFSGVNFYKSTDYGVTLTQVTSTNTSAANYMHVDHHHIISNPYDANKIYVATDGGIYRSFDFGANYTRCNNKLVTAQFYGGFSCSETDSNLAIGGLQDNGIARYDGSSSWYRPTGGDGTYCSINRLRDSSIIMGDNYLEIRYSSKKAAQNTLTTTFASNSVNANFISPIVRSRSDTGVVYAGAKKIFKSTNGGLNWDSLSSALDGNKILSIAVSYTSPDTLYAATVPNSGGANQMGFFKSTNGSANWTNITTGLPNRYPNKIAVDPADSRIVYAAFGGFGTSHVYKTTDGGSSWSDINGVLPDVPVQSIVIDPQISHNVYLGTDIGMYISTNSGTTWSSFGDGLPEAIMIFDLSISPANNTIRAATHGRGVYERKLWPDSPLPVELNSFVSFVNENNVTLKWETLSEQNNREFVVEKKKAGGEWSFAGKVNGAGNSQVKSFYSFYDKNLSKGIYSYRLKQIDYNGSFKYYDLRGEVVIGVPNKFALMQNYPNPFNPATVINYQLAINSFVELKIYDISGREVSSLVNEVKEAGYYSVSFDAKNLASGMYFYRLSTDKLSEVKKMVVLK
ncbi:MAG: T9SS type A sorting domain-containing protein [Bacteroidetes bacterium]|nr:T9SS type A sorting domain-containing protein [Bacteroidota bacterium]